MGGYSGGQQLQNLLGGLPNNLQWNPGQFGGGAMPQGAMAGGGYGYPG